MLYYASCMLPNSDQMCIHFLYCAVLFLCIDTMVKQTKTHEASLRKHISTFFRVAQLGTPKHFLNVLKLNNLYQIQHNEQYFGWIAFAHLRKLVFQSSKVLPPYIVHFAPYLTQCSFYIQRYLHTLSPATREKFRPLFETVNKLVRTNVFSDALYYGVDRDDQITEDVQTLYKYHHTIDTRAHTCPVLGKCKHGGKHGPFRTSLRGVTCTTCGRVGNKTYRQHFDARVVSSSKLAFQSTASSRDLPPTALDFATSGSSRSVTRSQFVSQLGHPLLIPLYNSDAQVGVRRFTIPRELQDWFVYLFDLIKDNNIDRGARPERLSKNWTTAIWIYGYLVWITVGRHRFAQDRAEARQVDLSCADHSKTKEMYDPTRSTFRHLETYFCTHNLVYYRVRGSTYRFYPAKLMPPQFHQCTEDPELVYADSNVRALTQVHASGVTGVRVSFWNEQYTLMLDRQLNFHVRATPNALECYFHLMVSKKAKVHFVCLQHTNCTFKVHPWEDDDMVAKHPKLAHYFIHADPLRNARVSKLVYKIGAHGPEQTVELPHLKPNMKRQIHNLTPKIQVCIRPAKIVLTRTVKEWTLLSQIH